MKLSRVLLGNLLVFATFAPIPYAVAKDRITILYDAFGDSSKLKRDWGFSALIEHDGKRILFDTGNNADIFAANVRSLSMDPSTLDLVVISHRHADHSTGLKYVLSVNPQIMVYAPKEGFSQFGGTLPGSFLHPVTDLPGKMRYFGGDYPQSLPSGRLYDGGNFTLVDSLTEILPGVWLVPTVSKTPGTLELHELTLAIKQPTGLLLVVGCSHAGIEEILRAASNVDSRIHIIFGGFHLVTAADEEVDKLADNLKAKWKVEKIAPGHCTGEPAFFRLQKVFGENYVFAGLGTQIELR